MKKKSLLVIVFLLVLFNVNVGCNASNSTKLNISLDEVKEIYLYYKCGSYSAFITKVDEKNNSEIINCFINAPQNMKEIDSCCYFVKIILNDGTYFDIYRQFVKKTYFDINTGCYITENLPYGIDYDEYLNIVRICLGSGL